jgi:hypothetical protein
MIDGAFCPTVTIIPETYNRLRPSRYGRLCKVTSQNSCELLFFVVFVNHIQIGIEIAITLTSVPSKNPAAEHTVATTSTSELTN